MKKRDEKQIKKYIVIFIIMFSIISSMVVKEVIDQRSIGKVEIYYRGFDIIGDDDVPEGPRLHPILKIWNGDYYELSNDEGIINIREGKLNKMNNVTIKYMKEKPEPDEIVEVNKKKFLEAVKKFSKKNEGKDYHALDFSDNSIAFKDFVLDVSKV